MPVNQRTTSRRRARFTAVLGLVACTLLIAVVASHERNARYRRYSAYKADVAHREIAEIVRAVERYRQDVGTFPTANAGLPTLLTPTPQPVGWHGPYLRRIPVDPWQRPYRYVYPGAHNKESFDIVSAGPDGVVDTPDDLGNW